jgi:hypothetical protein
MPYQPNFARGGSKPKMLPNSREVFITIGDQRKSGIYEFDERSGVLARRVELPEWLSLQVFAIPPSQDLLPFFVGRKWKLPTGEIGESKGNIYLDPPEGNHFGCPLVGLDVEIYEQFQSSGSVREILFVIMARTTLKWNAGIFLGVIISRQRRK